MLKREGISLIETLISLTIVSIALVALLPVMTVRKDANDLTKGNRYWKVISGNNEIKTISPISNYRVTIGNPVAPDINNDAVNFKVFNEGFKNKSVLPLFVTSGLFRWGGMTIDLSNDGKLDIYAGSKYTTDTGTFDIYPRRIYSDANKLVIENNSAVDTVYSYGSNATPYDQKNSTNYYSLVNEGKEYLSVDVTSKVIGIGKNAVRKYSGKGFIGIFNAPDSLKQSYILEDDSLIIGAKSGATDYSQKQDFIIWRAGNNHFYINAPVSVYTYKAAQIIVPSDKRLKNVMGNYDKSINELMRIKPVVYNLKSGNDKKSYVGVVAQDLQKIFPEAVVLNKATGYLMVSQDPVFYAMLNSIKDLDAQNKKLKNDNDKLEAKIVQLRAIRDRLKASQGGVNE